MHKPQRRSYCQRSGALLPISQLVHEPGTGLLVDRRYNDGVWNKVTTPQKDSPNPSRTEGKVRHKFGPNTDEFLKAGTLLAGMVDGELTILAFGTKLFRMD